MLLNLRNLGPASERMLDRAGITTEIQLLQIGSVKAYRAVQATGQKPSLNLLWAIEGALTDQSWQAISQQDRLSLLLALEQTS
ncbi:MAG: TfoX/Sxy family protein [Polaromonas sp.]|uniref:TfoX/Sxy family protein n=1 Tax=Polaromonas sp. TaxID=1869339 RepID=UPI0024881398|nr:TfoX/Sxy family protein [Polaromonas sp.]MDI1238626.1 TfoX/Sxy family protein [Polaromonas sp.]